MGRVGIKTLVVAILAINITFLHIFHLIFRSPEPPRTDVSQGVEAPVSQGEVVASSRSQNRSTFVSIDSYRKAIAYARHILMTQDEELYDSTLSNLTDKLSQSVWRQAWRQHHLAERCRQYDMQAHDNAFEYITFPPELPVGYCVNPKTGVSTWVKYLLLWSGLHYEEDVVHAASYENFQWFKSRQEAEHYVSGHRPLMLLSIRHPYDRLVSLYWDKFINTKDPFLADFANDCHRETRQLPLSVARNMSKKPSKLRENQTLNFPDLVHCLLNLIDFCDGDVRCLSHLEPHLRPMHLVCSPCDISYDVITKFESFEDDVDLVRHILLAEKEGRRPPSRDGEHSNLPHSKEQPPHPHGTSSRPSTEGHFPTRLIEHTSGLDALSVKLPLHLNPSVGRQGGRKEITELLGQLSKGKQKQLREMYKLDFLLFDYDPKEYL